MIAKNLMLRISLSEMFHGFLDDLDQAIVATTKTCGFTEFICKSGFSSSLQIAVSVMRKNRAEYVLHNRRKFTINKIIYNEKDWFYFRSYSDRALV